MNYLDSETIKERLPKKGFEESICGQHWQLIEYKCVQIKTSSINMISSYDEKAVSDITKSLMLNLKNFQKLIECNIDKDEYYKKFIEPKLTIEK